MLGNVNLQHSFKKGQTLNINLDYLTYNNSNPTNYESQYYLASGDLVRNTESRIAKKTPIHIWVGKSDYAFNLGRAM